MSDYSDSDDVPIHDIREGGKLRRFVLGDLYSILGHTNLVLDTECINKTALRNRNFLRGISNKYLLIYCEAANDLRTDMLYISFLQLGIQTVVTLKTFIKMTNYIYYFT
jgi:hypothetical protein